MPTKHELIEHLMDSLKGVSYRNRKELDAFKQQAEAMIRTLPGDTSEYRYQLQAARFAPWAFEAGEEDYQKSWELGKQSILDTLKAIDADEKLNLQDAPAAKKIESVPENLSFPNACLPARQAFIGNPQESPQEESKRVPLLHFILNKFKNRFPTQKLPASAPAVAPEVSIETPIPPTQDNVPAEQPEPPQEEPPTPAASTSPKPPQLSKRILLIHGSDDKMKENVSAALKKWGCTVILSFDRENFHKPLAQKMTEFCDAALVIALLSFDGYFYGKDQKVKDAKFVSQPKVIFELGFMIGKFGRDKVFVLYDEKKNYELPTDFFNAYYIPYHENRIWQDDLLKALKNHGAMVNCDERKS